RFTRPAATSAPALGLFGDLYRSRAAELRQNVSALCALGLDRVRIAVAAKHELNRAFALGDGELLGLFWGDFNSGGWRRDRTIVDARLTHRANGQHAHVRHEQLRHLLAV